MAIRIGVLVVTAQGLLLALAVAWFVRLGLVGLRAGPCASRGQAWCIVLAAGLGGAVGALLQGLACALAGGLGDPSGLAVRAQLGYGSFGALWGVLACGAFCAWLLGRDPVDNVDALAPAALVALMVDRAGGLWMEPSWAASLARGPGAGGGAGLGPLSLLDLAALMVIVSLQLAPVRGRWMRRPGAKALLALVGYGVLRFVVEAARPATSVAGPLTAGQILSATQVAAGLLVAWGLAAARHTAGVVSGGGAGHDGPDPHEAGQTVSP